MFPRNTLKVCSRSLKNYIGKHPSRVNNLVLSQPYASFAEALPGSARSGDLIWILGSAAVFVPTMAYLLSPAAPKPSSTSSANPVPDRWSRSFEETELKATQLNRPIISEDDGNVPAGEGRPHGAGDKALRQITTPTETHAQHQSTHGEPENFKAIPEKMDESRSESAGGSSGSTNMSTKTVSAKAHTEHQAKNG